MPMVVPGTPGRPESSGIGVSPLSAQENEKASPTSLLMAAATMQKLGRFTGQKAEEPKKLNRKTKVL